MAKNKTTLVWLAILIVAVIVINILVLTPKSNSNIINIGGVFHLTGPGSFWGSGEKNGVLMAIEEANLNDGINGKEIKLIIEDGETDFPKTTNAIQKLVNVDGVKVIIGPTWFGQIASPLAEEFKVLIISPSAGVVPEPNSYFFDVWPTEKQEVEPIVNHMDEEGIKNIALIYSLNDFSQSVRDNFIEQSELKGMNIVKEFPVNPDENDFRTIILAIKELNVDAIYGTFAFYPSQGAFSKQAEELDLDLTLYSSSGTEIPDLLQAYPEIEGTVYGYIDKGLRENEFTERYMEKFDSFPSPSSAYGYDSANLIIESLKAGKQSPEKMSEYFMNLKDYLGVSNTITFDDNGRVTNKTFVVKTVKNGEFVNYEE